MAKLEPRPVTCKCGNTGISKYPVYECKGCFWLREAKTCAGLANAFSDQAQDYYKKAIAFFANPTKKP